MNLYTAERGRLAMMYRNELIAETKCLMPCTYMEYEVSNSLNNYIEIIMIFNVASKI